MKLIRSRFMIFGLIAISMAGLAIFPACQSSAEMAEISPSEKLFKSKCRSCHALPKPASRSTEEWHLVLAKHTKRVKLTAEQKQMIISHLTGSWQPVATKTN